MLKYKQNNHNCYYCKYSKISTNDIEEIFCYKHKRYIEKPLEIKEQCFISWSDKNNEMGNI